MQGSYIEIVQSVITSLVGVYALSAAIEGYLHRNLGIVFRTLLLVSALCLIYSGILTDIVGLVLFIGIFIYNKKQANMNLFPVQK